jgi:hypothetical protein
MGAEKAYSNINMHCRKLRPIASSRQIAFQMTGAAFEEGPAGSSSPFFMASNAIQGMKTVMTGLP